MSADEEAEELLVMKRLCGDVQEHRRWMAHSDTLDTGKVIDAFIIRPLGRAEDVALRYRYFVPRNIERLHVLWSMGHGSEGYLLEAFRRQSTRAQCRIILHCTTAPLHHHRTTTAPILLHHLSTPES